jgi:putative transposase
MRVYKFRIYPDKKQEQVLFKHFDLCRFTYNQLLEELSHNKTRSHIQHHILTLKEKYPDIKQVYSKTLQYECYRLFSNLRGLSQSKKKGIKIGHLRFKGRHWFKTIVYNQSGFKLLQTKKRFNILELSKIGSIKILQHRLIEGNIKGIIIKRKVDTWEAHIITDGEYKIEKGLGIIGIDLGIKSFLTDNNNNKIDSPLYFRKSLSELKHKSQNLSRKKKGSIRRFKARVLLAKLHEHILQQRDDFLHKITTKLVNNNQFIGAEDLNIKSMSETTYNARNILDSSWGKFLSMLSIKAESAGCLVVKVNPKNTTRMCSKCGSLQEMPLHVRQYNCYDCGLSLDRDHNSAINILKKALEQGIMERKQEFSDEMRSHILNTEGVRV